MGFGKNNTGVILRDTFADALGALAVGNAVKIGSTLLEEDFRLLKAEILATVVGLTGSEAECLILGICDNELTDVEIADCIKARVVDRNDRLENEKVTRPAFPIGMQVPAIAGGTTIVDFNVNGEPMVSKKRWTYSNEEGFSLFIYNAGSQALTAGATFRGIATYYGVWVT